MQPDSPEAQRAAQLWHSSGRTRTTSPLNALRMLEDQYADPAEVRTRAYEQQRQRYGRIRNPDDALSWLIRHTAIHVGPDHG